LPALKRGAMPLCLAVSCYRLFAMPKPAALARALSHAIFIIKLVWTVPGFVKQHRDPYRTKNMNWSNRLFGVTLPSMKTV
jgi:hypothetical protein